MKIALVKE